MKSRERTTRIRQFIVDRVALHDHNVATRVAKKFGISPQAVQRHLNAMVAEGTLEPVGRTRARYYVLRPIAEELFDIRLSPGLAEWDVWQNEIVPRLDDRVPQNVFRIVQYGFTEMLNNAVAHSESDEAIIKLLYTLEGITIRIHDEGVGVFKKIVRHWKYPHERDAAAQLAKGRLTSDPEQHSGQGIFFSLRAFDRFSLMSGHLMLHHEVAGDIWNLETDRELTPGTSVIMDMALRSKRTLTEVFDAFADPGLTDADGAFSLTHVPMKIFLRERDTLISRSQAKRVAERLEKFSKALIDFRDIDFIGQAFADELFRVFPSQFPGIELVPVNTNDDVLKMIRGVSTRIADRARKYDPPQNLRG